MPLKVVSLANHQPKREQIGFVRALARAHHFGRQIVEFGLQQETLLALVELLALGLVLFGFGFGFECGLVGW